MSNRPVDALHLFDTSDWEVYILKDGFPAYYIIDDDRIDRGNELDGQRSNLVWWINKTKDKPITKWHYEFLKNDDTST